MSNKEYTYREYSRFLTKLHVRYINTTKFNNLSITDKLFHARYTKLGYASDFSENGLFLLISELIGRDDILEMSMSLPIENKTIRVTVTGHVRWSRNKHKDEFNEPRYDEYKFCAGIEFNRQEKKEDIELFINYWRSLGSKLKPQISSS